MKKIILIVVLLVAGFFLYQYLNDNTDKKTALEAYHDEMEMPYMKMKTFFQNAEAVLISKDESTLEKDIEGLASDLRVVGSDMAMVTSTDEELRALHSDFLKKLKAARKALLKAKKGKEGKMKNSVAKEVKKMAEYYDGYKKKLEEQYLKYGTKDANKPEPTQETTKYDEYDSYLENPNK